MGRQRGSGSRVRGATNERSWGTIIIIAAVVAIIVAFVTVVVLDFRSGAAGGPPGGVEDIEVGEAGQHTEGEVNYDQTPPAGGEHNPDWQNAGFYSEPVTNENAVHTLEHGAVWITYNPDLPQGQVDELQQIANNRECVLVSPYPDLGSPVVASAWGKQLDLEGAEDPALNRFIGTSLQGEQTPEPGAACTGGVGEPS
ncbi:hypothetical protein BH24ACT21_BH24ACT21_07560 [soil metagenome]